MTEEQVVQLSDKISRLKDEHFSIELKIEEIRKKPMLTTDDHVKITNLKKMKLMTKDKITELNAILVKHNTSN